MGSEVDELIAFLQNNGKHQKQLHYTLVRGNGSKRVWKVNPLTDAKPSLKKKPRKKTKKKCPKGKR